MQRWALRRVLIFLATLLAGSAHGESLKLWHTANAGVLIDSGEHQVLVDALYRAHPEWKGFTYTHLDLQKPGRDGIPEGLLEGIDIVLATHVHRDHFHPETVASFLRLNPDARLVASTQVVESLFESDVNSNEIRDRLLIHDAEAKGNSTWSQPGLQVTLTSLPHAGASNAWIDHNALLIETGGRRILHVGDANPDPDLFAPFQSKDQPIDLVIAPYWFLLQPGMTDAPGPTIVNEIIDPTLVLAVHLPPEPESIEAIEQLLKETYPRLVVASGTLESIDLALLQESP